MAALCAALVVTPVAPAQTQLGAHRVLHAADLQADVGVLRSALEQLHPGLYRYNTKRQMDAAFAALRRDFGRDQTLESTFLRLSRFTAQIRCGHTYPSFYNQSKAITRALFERDIALPFFYRWIGGRMIVTSDFTPDSALARGTAIYSINGVDTKIILQRLLPLARADGSNDAKRIDLMELQGTNVYEAADVYLPMLYPSWGSRFSLRVHRPRDTGSSRVAIAGVERDDRRRITAALHPDKTGTEALFTLRYLRNGSALLTMPTWEMYKTKWDWRKWTNDALDDVIEKHAPVLIVDLRANEGGDDVGDLILARLTHAEVNEQPEARLVRYRSVPSALRPHLATWDASFFDWGARASELAEPWPTAPALMYYSLSPHADDSTDAPRKQSRKFTGKLFVLTDASNSSATFRFERIVQQQHVGTLVGLPTGGNQRGINGGSFFFLTLPHSGIEIDVPLVGYFPQRLQPDAGLEPDIRVERTATDIAGGIDAVLARIAP